MVRVVEGLLLEIPGIRVKEKRLAAQVTTVTGFLLTHWFVLFGTQEVDKERFVDETADLLSQYLFG